MTLDFSPWVALILGILIGWLLGWFLDLFFDRRRRAEDERRRAELEELRRLRDLEVTSAPVVAIRSDVPDTAAAIEEEPLPPLPHEFLEEDVAPPTVKSGPAEEDDPDGDTG